MPESLNLSGEIFMLGQADTRLFWPFLLSALLIISIVTKQKGLKEFLGPSSLLDFKILGINTLLKIGLFPLLLFSSYQTSLVLLKLLRSLMPHFSPVPFEGITVSLFVTILAFVIDDFFRFIHHYLMHNTPILRLLHRTHHSALVLTPFTLYRTHPLEALMASARNILSIGLILALFSFLFQRPVTGMDILGVNLFGFLFNAALANLRHSSVPLSFGYLEYVFISPRMHQIHHSNNPKHFNKNYGVALAIWDQLFKSYYRPQKSEFIDLSYGLHQNPNEDQIMEATTVKGSLIPLINKERVVSLKETSDFS
jgi:sterol desaturase/sphingolipid hydroxylase (fatty acid hydroxylase superfamily)